MVLRKILASFAKSEGCWRIKKLTLSVLQRTKSVERLTTSVMSPMGNEHSHYSTG